MRLYCAASVRETERHAERTCGFSEAVMIESAAGALLRALRGLGAPAPFAVVCGGGNNGADGFSLARRLRLCGLPVTAVAAAKRFGPDCAEKRRLAEAAGVPVADWFNEPERARAALGGAGTAVDCVFGSGYRIRPGESPYDGLFDCLSAAPLVCAADVPSGVEGDTGRAAAHAVRAHVTFALSCAKPGLLTYPGASFAGRVEVLPICIPETSLAAVPADGFLTEREDVRRLLPARPETGHKGTFGHLWVAGGSRGMTGSVWMAATAGARLGAGRVTVLCPDVVEPALSARFTEVMTRPAPADPSGALGEKAAARLPALRPGEGALVCGCGLRAGEEQRLFVAALLRTCRVPLLLDADALNALPALSFLPEARAPVLLTPHPAELGRLLDISARTVNENRLPLARAFARKYGVTVLLKGARSVIAAPDGRFAVNPTVNAALAKGGSGDVLAGMAGALLAQGAEPFAAAAAAAWLHGRCADRLCERSDGRSVLPGDLIGELGPALKEALTGA